MNRRKSSNYDKYPAVPVPGNAESCVCGYTGIVQRLRKRLGEAADLPKVLVVDTYPGVDDSEVLPALIAGLEPARVLNTINLKKAEPELRGLIDRNLTNDRIFGVLSCHQLAEFIDEARLREARRIASEWRSGLLLVYGVGASLVCRGDVLIYADMARWEIQRRFRKGMGNWGAGNGGEDFFRKYKRGFFVEWRVADRHKFSIFDQIDFLLDTNTHGEPKLLAARTLHEGLRRAATRPFRVVPFFDQAPWGGQWMKGTCDLDREVANYGWCFDCVPEENSLLLDVAGTRVEMPSINVVHRHPRELLGDMVHARFGCEFPIRFDFLDTVGGGNLSLQVHPLTGYIQQAFGMHYTQDESYYMLEAEEDATVYLGLKEGVDKESMIHDLRMAQESSGLPFPAEKYVARWPARKHDHFLIPAGTVHCSGKNSMVLEISATPYIFTFKMWDWGRLGLDGLPRPVHLEHGLANIKWERTADWVAGNLVNRFDPIAEGPGWREERTGLHELEFIETRRHWFTGKVPHHTQGGVNVLNLVEGQEAIVESPDGSFEPLIVHYAETFIIPASVGPYTIHPRDDQSAGLHATLKAFVRT